MDWIQDKEEVEIVDLILRIREKLVGYLIPLQLFFAINTSFYHVKCTLENLYHGSKYFET